MAERGASRVILVDGPMAGHLYGVPEDARHWVVQVPRPLNLFLANPTEIRTLTDDTVYYQLGEVFWRPTGAMPPGRRVRVGWSGNGQPAKGDLLEHVPTGLAESGVIGWDEVPVTLRDRAEPVGVERHGDVQTNCGIKVSDPNWMGATEIDAACACGWRTERVTLDRRSQLLRAAHRHALGECARRDRFRLPVTIVSGGSGAEADCYGGIAVDEPAERVFGRCRRCGWQTERVEYYRTGPLRELCMAHTGPDGVRRVRDQLLAAYGLPAADKDPEPAAPQMWGVHDNETCAESETAGEFFAFKPTRCIGGTVYGLCGHENCYGACEDMGACGCACHEATASDGSTNARG